ncbi:hypothetical protein [Paenibacillus sp. J31TS4]|uniref:hypothetical protein n=1 Tax=Paenibacillus sp. J31TS4 TaxID=2807195 RepID=UPI001BCCDB0F|nr:hypothetical protein [Paenibacillus sp. J31TS4]
MVRGLIGLAKLLAGTILISGLTLYFTWTVVHTYADKLLGQFGVETGGLKLTDLMTSMSDDVSRLTGGKGADGRTGEAAGSAAPGSGTAGAGGASPSPTPGPDAQAVFGQSGSSLGGAQAGTGGQTGGALGAGAGIAGNQAGGVVLSPEELQKKKGQLSEADKVKIFSLLTSLPSDDLQKLSRIVEDGVTEQEMTEIKQLVESRLKPNDYNQLMTILSKY